MHELIRIHNDLSELPLKNFTGSEIDILNALCYVAQGRGADEIVLPLDEIRSLADFRSIDRERFINVLMSTNRKLQQLSLVVHDNRKIVQFVLFPKFIIDPQESTLTVCVSDVFLYLLNQLTHKFTTLELRESAMLTSSYAKKIYRRLREFRDKGCWTISIDAFRSYLDIPPSFSTWKIDNRVILPSVTELEEFFHGLSVEKTYEKHIGRGRPSVSGYIFTFDPQPHKKSGSQQPKLTQHAIAKHVGWVKTEFVCPRCHKTIYCKQMENSRGLYMMYGHTDWKTGRCDFTSYDSAELIPAYKIEEQKDREVVAETYKATKREKRAKERMEKSENRPKTYFEATAPKLRGELSEDEKAKNRSRVEDMIAGLAKKKHFED